MVCLKADGVVVCSKGDFYQWLATTHLSHLCNWLTMLANNYYFPCTTSSSMYIASCSGVLGRSVLRDS